MEVYSFINGIYTNWTIYDVIKNMEKIKWDLKKEILKFKKTFINFFSLGFDVRIGFQFEQRRPSIYFSCSTKNYGLTVIR